MQSDEGDRGREPRYNRQAVDAAIRGSRQKISTREGRLIHALLRGRDRG